MSSGPKTWVTILESFPYARRSAKIFTNNLFQSSCNFVRSRYCSHFPNGATKTRRTQRTCPKSNNWSVIEPAGKYVSDSATQVLLCFVLFFHLTGMYHMVQSLNDWIVKSHSLKSEILAVSSFSWPLNNMDLNCMGWLSYKFFQRYILE